MSDFDAARGFANGRRKKRRSLDDYAMEATLTEIATSLRNLEKLFGSVVIDGRLHVNLRSDDD
jgi:hypothetical protein